MTKSMFQRMQHAASASMIEIEGIAAAIATKTNSAVACTTPTTNDSTADVSEWRQESNYISDSETSETIVDDGDETQGSCESEIDVESTRRRLCKMYHAATCTADKLSCTLEPHCFACRRLFSHMISCSERMACPVPGCKKSRRIWTHYRQCVDSSCYLCESAPTGYADLRISQTIKSGVARPLSALG